MDETVEVPGSEPFAVLEIPAPDESLLTRASQALDTLRALKVTSEDDYRAASAWHAQIKGIRNAIEEQRKGMKRPVDALAAAIQAYHRPALEFCDESEQIVEGLLTGWLAEQEAMRKALQQAADDQADKERQRLQRLAERAAERGDHNKAEQLETRAATLVPVIVPKATPKVAGQSLRANYTFEIVDEKLLPREWLCPDEQKIRRYVKAMRDEARIPGVRVMKDTTIVSRGV